MTDEGKPLRLEPEAASADPQLPAFVARPAGAPVYHGFPLLEETRTPDGWCFGVITDPVCPAGSDWGDAFVVAPDGSRAGLVWQTGLAGLEVILAPGPDRWGVYGVPVSRLIYTQAELATEMHGWLPALREQHAAWVAGRSSSGPAALAGDDG